MKWVKWAVIAVGVIVAVYLIRTVGRPTNATAVTAHNDSLLALTDSLRADNSLRAQRETLYIRRARSLQHDAAMNAAQLTGLASELERASTALDSLRIQDSTIRVQRWVIYATEQRCNALDSAYSGCAERAALLQVRIDTLTSALRKQIAVTGCKVLVVVPCLTRFQSLGLGLLVGAGVGYGLTR